MSEYEYQPILVHEEGSINDAGDTPPSVGKKPNIALRVLSVFKVWDPSSIVFRVLMLALVCGVTFGSYFCYDIPGSLQGPIIDQFGIQGSNIRFELLYSLYSWPNVIVVFFGGFLIDRVFGLRLGAIIFCFLVLLGQLIFSFGISVGGFSGYLIAASGRFVFGLGGESLAVAQNTYCAKWFRGKEFAMAFGITISFSRIGSAVNFNLEPYVEQYLGLSIAVWLGFILCFVSLLSAVAAFVMDKAGEMTVRRRDPELYDRQLQVKADEPVRLTDVVYFPLSLWIIYAICITFYVAVFVFITLSTDFMVFKYKIAPSVAAHLTSIPYLESAILSPFLGFFVDKVGFSVIWMIVASSMLLFSHVFFLVVPIQAVWVPIIPLVVMGIAYSILAAALWPCVAYIIDTRRLGTAYGLMTALQNLGLAVAPLIVGAITTSGTKLPDGEITGASYTAGVYFFIVSTICSLVLSIALLIVDFFRGRQINASAKTIRRRLEQVGEDLVEPVKPMEIVEFVENPKQIQRTNAVIRHAYLSRIGISPPVPAAIPENPDL